VKNLNAFKWAMMGALLAAPMSAPSVRAEEKQPGMTGTSVVIGTSIPLTGPAAEWGLAATAQEAFIARVNDSGGLNGRMLKLVALDDGYIPPRTLINLKDMFEGGGAFALVGIFGSGCVSAAGEYVTSSGIPWVSPYTDSRNWVGRGAALAAIFAAYPDYFHEGRILADYASGKMGLKKIAVFREEGADGSNWVKGAREGVAGRKAKLVLDLPFDLSITGVRPFALKIAQAKAAAVMIFAGRRHAAMLARALSEIKPKPVILATFTLGDPAMFDRAGEAWEGTVASSFFASDEDEKAAKLIGELSVKTPLLKKSPFIALAGIAMIEPMLEGIKKAGRELSRDTFMLAMEDVRNFDGYAARGVTYGPGRRQGVDRIFLVKMEKGKRLKLTDWIQYPVEY